MYPVYYVNCDGDGSPLSVQSDEHLLYSSLVAGGWWLVVGAVRRTMFAHGRLDKGS